jgi:hypothetical protein
VASYKRLKSLAHNVVHQFLSTLNYVHGQYVFEDLFQSARSVRSTHVTIDLLTGIVEPESVRTPRLDTAIESARNWLGDLPAPKDVTSPSLARL